MEYPYSIQCPCTNIAMPLSKIISIYWTYHQICSSQFASSSFYLQLASIRTNSSLYRADFMLMSTSFFQYINTFCLLSNVVAIQQYQEFGTTLFVNAKLLSPNSFETQVNQLIQSFIYSTSQAFSDALEKLLESTASNQYLSASYVSYNININGNLVYVDPGHFLGCSCLLNARTCSMPAAFYEYNQNNDSFTPIVFVTGVKLACWPMESFLQSSLTCLYTPECYQTVCSIFFLLLKIEKHCEIAFMCPSFYDYFR